jgi:poly(3-hydroxybutyrate) depolymerase
MLAMRDGAAPGTVALAAPSAGVPVIVFHGDADATVHRENSAGVVLQSIDSRAVSTIEEQGESGGRRFTRSIHAANDGAVLAEQWTVHGAGHAWSGGSAQGSYADRRGPDASREMLRFFLTT